MIVELDAQVTEQEVSPVVSRSIFWVVLGLITLAEFLTSVVQAQVGMVLHAIILAGLLAYAGLARADVERRLAFALILAPIIRLLSLSLPLPRLPQMAWYPAVSLPLLVTTWFILHQTTISAQAIGFRKGRLWLQGLFSVGGFSIGLLEYYILRPPELGSFSVSALSLVVVSINLILFTGLTEEIIFRGLLQTLALPVLGRFGLIYIAVLFGVMHIGYLSIIDVVFVFIVGLLFGYIVHWGGSLLGVTLGHGLANITLFVIMPFLVAQMPDMVPLVLWIGSGTTLVCIISMMVLYRGRTSAEQEVFETTNDSQEIISND